MICNLLLECFLVKYLKSSFDVLRNSVSCSFFVPNFAISEFLTRTSSLFGSLIMLFVGLILSAVLPGARTSFNPSKFFSVFDLRGFFVRFLREHSIRYAGLVSLFFPTTWVAIGHPSFFLFLVGSTVRCINRFLYFCVGTQGRVCPLFFCQVRPARNCIFI